MQPQGATLVIGSVNFDASDRMFDRSGKLQPVAQYRKFELQTYAEHGSTDWLTLIFAFSSSQSTGAIGFAQSSDAWMRGEAGARVRLWQSATDIFSAQATLRAPYAINPGLPPGLRREVYEGDFRLLYGRSFEVLGRAGFVSAEAGYRTRAGLPDEWRADITLGYRLFPRFLLLAQNFNVLSQGSQNVPRMRSHKFQVSGVFDLTPRLSIQAGVYGALAGQNMRNERGVVGAVWRRF